MVKLRVRIMRVFERISGL